MIRVILSGCNGQMGRVLTRMIAERADMEVVAGIDLVEDGSLSYPVYPSLRAAEEEADVVIDFSVADAVDDLLATCVARKLPLVLCTTGLMESHLQHIGQAVEAIPVLRSANMSLGVNLLIKLAKDAARALSPAHFDIEIVEQHHRRKLDAPSGTAMALGEEINDALGGDYAFVFDRSARREQRPEKEIGISAVRGGSIVGEHDVIFAGEDEVITLKHSAYSRAIFAKGALTAAAFLCGKPAGHYSMEDVLGE